ncbi:MAG: hypothetical protein H7844_11910 [Nitrospirae bacterium YQR-1]
MEDNDKIILKRKINRDGIDVKPAVILSKSLDSVDPIKENTIETEDNTETGDSGSQGTDIYLSIENIINANLEIFGEQPFKGILNNPVLDLDEENTKATVKQWMSKMIKTYFTYDDIDAAEKNLKNNYIRLKAQYKNSVTQRQKLEEMLITEQQGKKTLNEKYDELAVFKYKLQKQLNSMVPLRDFVQISMHGNKIGEYLLQLTAELSESNNPAATVFIIRLCKCIREFQDIISKGAGSEKELMENVYHWSISFLHEVSGMYFTERKNIMNAIGRVLSSYFENYDFISPEDSLHVDPKIHDVRGLGGKTVKEGKSFLVLRKDTRQTVLLAQITTE